MSTASNILKLSNLLYRLTSLSLVLLPLAVLGFALRDAMMPETLAERFPTLSVTATPGTALMAALAGLLPMIAMLYALAEMRGLFARYRKGEILTEACAARIQGLGQGLFALAALSPIAHMLQVLALTWHNPPGQKVLQISLDGSLLGFLLSGALMVLIGRVMREASRIAAENAEFV